MPRVPALAVWVKLSNSADAQLTSTRSTTKQISNSKGGTVGSAAAGSSSSAVPWRRLLLLAVVKEGQTMTARPDLKLAERRFVPSQSLYRVQSRPLVCGYCRCSVGLRPLQKH